MDLLQVTLQQQAPISLGARLECQAGKVLALVGPSGSDKSTILRCIAGSYKPASGLIRFNEPVWYSSAQRLSTPTQLRHCGYAFQDFALMPHLSVFDKIGMGLDGLPSSLKKNRVDALLKRVSLGGLENRKPSQL